MALSWLSHLHFVSFKKKYFPCQHVLEFKKVYKNRKNTYMVLFAGEICSAVL